MNALWLGVKSRQHKVVEILLKSGADVNVVVNGENLLNISVEMKEREMI